VATLFSRGASLGARESMDAVLVIWRHFLGLNASGNGGTNNRHMRPARPKAFTTQHHAICGSLKRVSKCTMFRPLRSLNEVFRQPLVLFTSPLRSYAKYSLRTSSLKELRLLVGAHGMALALGRPLVSIVAFAVWSCTYQSSRPLKTAQYSYTFLG